MCTCKTILFLYSYSYSVSEENHLLLDLHHHKKACRALAFSKDGLCKFLNLIK